MPLRIVKTEPEEATADDLRIVTTEPEPESEAPDLDVPSAGGTALFAGMKAVPGIVAGVNAGARAIGKAAKSRVGRLTPGIIALDAAGDVVRGDVGGAVKSSAAAAAMSQVPRVAAAVQHATAPTSGVSASGVKWTLKPGMGGGLSRLAALVSRISGPVAVGYEALFGDNAAGHRPYGEMAETTAARQAQFAREYQAMVNAKRPGTITGTTVDEILASIARYRGSR